MNIMQSIADAQARTRAKREAAPSALDALIERAAKLHPINLGLQALVYIEALNLFHPSRRAIQTAIKEMRARVLTIEEARIEITEAIRAFRATLPEVRHD